MNTRTLYRAKIEFLFKSDDEILEKVRELISQHSNIMFARMSEDNIQVVLRTDFWVTQIGDVTENDG